jgi:hypothetical protein
VAEENERRRQEAERNARIEREREQAELEQKAIEAEEASPTLSEREEAFVNSQIALGLGPTDAARRAGFKNPEQAAERLMKLAKIREALDAKKRAAAIREQAAAKKEQPVDVQFEEERPNITRATPGGFDRTSHSGEVLDERLFVEAVIGGRHGIPADVLMVNQAKLNEYARSMQELINRWPGVRHKKTTTTV